jgi:hypothetical protein
MAIGISLDNRKNAAAVGDGFFYLKEIVPQSGQINFRNGWTAFHVLVHVKFWSRVAKNKLLTDFG